ncbi:DEKNAAC101514 [Brettanomyces naardenensis]|uniref:DEKNAAC101514 n=1 Tax=Brettanomyces naardenensis TaxID=13370 RepID=A0A448YIA5_BRENA|nr:DEKNAAC101514 [Brettanomyces naardenensis]
MFLRLASRGLRKPSTVIGLRQFIVAKPPQLRTPTILSFGAVRFNSTDAAKEAVNSESVSQAVKDALNSTSSKFDTTLGFDPDTVVANGTSSVTDAVSHVTDLTSDQLGYLHSVGLVDGWYPSDIMQEALELVHVFSGMPWWLTITLTTIGIRLLLFPLFMKSSNTMAKSQLIMPQTKRLRNEINTAVSRGDQRMQQIKMFQLKQLNKKYGIKYRDMFISPVIQMTFAMGAFFGVREMANLPVEGFSNGGSMWFTDLTAADPYIGLQLISACLYAASFKWGGETAVAQYGPKMKKIFMALPFVSVLFTWNLSAGVMVYLTANGLCSIVQSRLLRSDEFRKWAKMAPLNMQKAEAAAADEEKSKGMMGNLTQQWDDMKTNASIRTDMEEKANKAIALQKKKARSSRVIIKKRRDRAN